ncbi:MAG: ABC transporter ATP-binding protein [Kiritimatiellia bacterium]|jgi:putative ABC transport system ATP-binding protein
MSQPNESAVRFENLCKVYEMGDQKVHALAGVSAQFEKGSFWAIMGPSGSGKSTMLNILGCLDRPTSGAYHLDGRDVSALDDDDLSDIRLKHIGFIFQSFNLIPQLTVAENIELPLYYQGVDSATSAAVARRFAGVVGLEDRLGHKPTELSGGQQQRVAIARAMATDPVLLLADEPTGNLDSKTSAEIMELLVAMNQSGKTIVMVTHEPDVAAYAQSRMIMKDGRIDHVE